MPISVFYISDRAYNHLVHLAQTKHYVKWGTKRAKGLSNFLNDLALDNFSLSNKSRFIDTRPPLVKQRHEEEIRLDRAPSWLHTRTRRAHNLILSEDTINKYMHVALQMGIAREEPYTIGNRSTLSPQPNVSLVLEGIGLTWITPDRLPDKAKEDDNG